jgi:hypothetical protein
MDGLGHAKHRGDQAQIGEDHRVVVYADKFHGISLPF